MNGFSHQIKDDVLMIYGIDLRQLSREEREMDDVEYLFPKFGRALQELMEKNNIYNIAIDVSPLPNSEYLSILAKGLGYRVWGWLDARNDVACAEDRIVLIVKEEQVKCLNERFEEDLFNFFRKANDFDEAVQILQSMKTK